MKTKFLIFLVTLFSIYSCSQSKTENSDDYIRKSLTAFVENIKEKKINSAVEFIYPRYFEVVQKEQMTQILNLTYNNPSIITEIQRFEIDKIEKPEKIKSEYYSIADYSFKMKLKINWNSIPNSGQAKSQIKEGLIKKYGNDNVQYFSDEDYYFINAKMKACAISSNEKDWTFLIVEPQYKPQLKSILPQKILNKF
ncbi:hypothetical protein [Chryseobacterium sp.]|uniref:hypothetical protein n=1 Tax=Chryseobacterium sp. TaxID=1871047 RepID=UPI0011C976CE|nr:hypothetical protein [Chryseobacterium sp.]TXF79228.1 hypothetical protein FUA25_02200 [Chryseobacterium sp.]